jgi:hypothetical protein
MSDSPQRLTVSIRFGDPQRHERRFIVKNASSLFQTIVGARTRAQQSFERRDRRHTSLRIGVTD